MLRTIILECVLRYKRQLALKLQASLPELESKADGGSRTPAAGVLAAAMVVAIVVVAMVVIVILGYAAMVAAGIDAGAIAGAAGAADATSILEAVKLSAVEASLSAS